MRSDEELLAEYNTGNQDAFTDLITRLRPRLVTMAGRILGNRDDAEDAVQIAMTRLFVHAPEFDGRRVWSWITYIVTNICRDIIRKRRRHIINIGDIQEYIDRIPDKDRNQSRIEAADEIRKIRRAVRDLPNAYQELLRLRMHGIQYEEMAAKSGYPIGTVKSHIHNARKLLKKALGPVVVNAA